MPGLVGTKDSASPGVSEARPGAELITGTSTLGAFRDVCRVSGLWLPGNGGLWGWTECSSPSHLHLP